MTWQLTALISHLLGCSRETGPTATNPVDDDPPKAPNRRAIGIFSMYYGNQDPYSAPGSEKDEVSSCCLAARESRRTGRCRPPPTVPSDDDSLG